MQNFKKYIPIVLRVSVAFLFLFSAAEVVVGLAIIVSIFKKQESASVDMLSSSKG